MTRRSAVVLALAGVPLLFCGLLIGCNSQGPVDPPETNVDRNERVQPSMDYMRKQYEEKQQRR